MRSQYNVREVYVGDDVTSAYTFDYKVIEKEHLLLVHLDDLGAVVWTERGNITTYFSVTLNAAQDGGTVNLLAALPDDHTLLILLADDEPTQPAKFTTSDRYTLKKIEDAFDTLSGQVQRMRYLLDRSFKFPEKVINGVGELPDMDDEHVIVLSYDIGTDTWSIVPVDINTLAGPQGPTGPTGATGPQGPQGVAGPAGAAGANGTNSLGIHSEAVDPNPGDGVDGDFWINTVSGDIFFKAAGTWSLEGNIIGPVGPTGPTGAQGIQGNTGPQGVQGIQGVAGNDGNTGPQGLKGDPGSQIYMNNGDPNVLVVGGVQGDMYVDQDLPLYYYRFESGLWVLKGQLYAGGGFNRKGFEALGGSISTVNVTFAAPMPDVLYAPFFTITNETDTDPIFLNGIVINKTVNGFDVKLNAPTDSANYVLEWGVTSYV